MKTRKAVKKGKWTWAATKREFGLLDMSYKKCAEGETGPKRAVK